MPKALVSTLDTTAEFARVQADLDSAAKTIMDYVEKEYREFCADNGITLKKGTRVTA